MSTSSLPQANATSPYPDAATLDSSRGAQDGRGSPPHSSASSIASSSASESETNGLSTRSTSRRTRADRPSMGDRQRSNSIIVPKGNDVIQREKPQYAPDDARAMSPRRSSVDLDRLEQDARKSLKSQAQTLQSSLSALVERIDEVRSDHDELEKNNRLLRDYIGGLTRTMSKDGIGRSASTAKKGRR